MKKIKLLSPMSGKAQPISEAPNVMFAKKECGDGFAIFPNGEDVIAPVDAKVDFVFPTKHCVGLITKEGLEIVLHVGMNTGHLEGEGFDVYVEPGMKVTAGERLLHFDTKVLKDHKVDSTSVMLFPNLKDDGMLQLESVQVDAGALLGFVGY